MRRPLFLCCCCMLVLLPAAAPAQTPQDSLAAWTQRLRTGRLVERLIAAEKLAGEAPASLPPQTREVVLAAFLQLNRELRSDQEVPGIEELGPEDLGAYYSALATLVYAFDTPEAQRALALSAGGSAGMLRRAAKAGDEVFPLLVERIRDGYAAGDALETMALAAFWADSTGTPLSDAARSTLVQQLNAATRSPNYDLLRSAAEAMRILKNPAYLPLARDFERRAVAADERLLSAALRIDVLPALAAAAAQLSPADLAGHSLRVLELLCLDVASGPRRGACTSLQNEYEAAIRHLRGGRTVPARNLLHSVIQRAAQARASGAVTEDEQALIAGGARQVLERLK